MEATVFAPSIVYSPGDPWITLLDRLTRLPVAPVSGSGDALYQPIWAEDVADCVVGALRSSNGKRPLRARGARGADLRRDREDGAARVRPPPAVAARAAAGRARRASRSRRRSRARPSFATWDEAELMELSMTTPEGNGRRRVAGREAAADGGRARGALGQRKGPAEAGPSPKRSRGLLTSFRPYRRACRPCRRRPSPASRRRSPRW